MRHSGRAGKAAGKTAGIHRKAEAEGMGSRTEKEGKGSGTQTGPDRASADQYRCPGHQERNFEYTVWKVIRNKILLMLILPSSADGKIMQNDGKARITGTRESVRQRSARGRTEPTAGYRRWFSPAAGGVCKVTAVERWQAEGSESRPGKA